MPAAEPSGEQSDVVLAESQTVAAPSFRAPAVPRDQRPTEPAPSPAERPSRNRQPMALLPGARIDDFEIIRLLGRGAFGHVYLARQVSLDREVALKVSANRGSEGRTMARLEHQHIVQVFSETVDDDFDQRLLCMQLVPGAGLERIIAALHPDATKAKLTDDPPLPWSGQELLATIDHSASLPTALDPSALHDREALARMDDIEATAWIGTRLAEALDFAHHHGVLHRDIKPANILVNSYGRPMLADFNISSQPVGSQSECEAMFGGTFAYMSPEHLDAFNPSDPTGPDAVTAKSDMYSLGLVLHQLLDGCFPVPLPKRHENIIDTLRATADARHSARPKCRPGVPSARKMLERTIGRCVEPLPEDRFQNGAELGEQLDGCRQLRQAERRLPKLRAVFETILRRPFFWLVLLTVLPQVVASTVNYAYNSTQIADRLDNEQKRLFIQVAVAYNVVVYPLAIALFLMAVRPVWRAWQALGGKTAVDDGAVAQARRRALRLPLWIAVLTAWGWFPGGFLFPVAIHAASNDGLTPEIAAHFVTSFCMSGLIALAYSLCGAQFVVLRVLYPGMWSNVRGFDETTRHELAPMASRLGWTQLLAVSIPLFGACLVLLLSDGATDRTFNLLVVSLIVLSGAGFHLTSAVTRGLSQVVVALTNPKG
jgi:eukaryotic-like serine/threonine-protein kinase